jgi:hypothetical protein
MTQMTDLLKAKKEEIKKDYLDGTILKEIAIKYGFKNEETVCYHLRPLTPGERALHMKNRYQRKEVQNGQS